MIDRNDFNYIYWRSKAVYMSSMVCGGIQVNVDNRLWNSEGKPFVLSFYEEGRTIHYAVSDEDAEAVASKIRKWYDDNPDLKSFPVNDSNPYQAAVSMGELSHKTFPEAELIKQWFEELRVKCGEPLSDKEFFHYTNPKPELKDGELNVREIIEQAVIPPHNPTLPVPPPDNRRSQLTIEDGIALLKAYCSGQYLMYVIPNELIPRINEAAADMLAKDADGYHVEGDADAWLTVQGREDKFDIEPEDAIKLFEELIPQCGAPLPQEHPNTNYGIYTNAVKELLGKKWTCHKCGETDNFGKMCITCGPSGEQKAKADIPWHCNKCNTDGNTGGYCCNCGSEYVKSDAPSKLDIGYRKGSNPFYAGGMVGFSMFAQQMQQNMQPQQEAKPEIPEGSWWCPFCGHINEGKFCCECGGVKPQESAQ